jgi:hypothetical protein
MSKAISKATVLLKRAQFHSVNGNKTLFTYDSILNYGMMHLFDLKNDVISPPYNLNLCEISVTIPKFLKMSPEDFQNNSSKVYDIICSIAMYEKGSSALLIKIYDTRYGV